MRVKNDRSNKINQVAMALIIATSAAGSAFAQVTTFNSASTMHGKTVIIPRNTTFEGRIDETLSSHKSKQGDKFSISTATPVLANGTDVLIPAGSQVLGEVVEAIPADHVQRMKGYPKPVGKLRVQLSGLRTPDGVTYPLVASLAGELTVSGGRVTGYNKNIGNGVAYVGDNASFEAVAPGAGQQNRGGRGPQVMGRDQVLRDPIYGGGRDQQSANQHSKIRSLIKVGRELAIISGSPLTIRLDAPLKMGIGAAQAAESTLIPTVETNPDGTFRKRFQREAIPQQTAEQQQAASPVENANPLPGILPDLPHGATTTAPPVVLPPIGTPGPGQQMPPAQGAPQGQVAPQGQAAPVGNDF